VTEQEPWLRGPRLRQIPRSRRAQLRRLRQDRHRRCRQRVSHPQITLRHATGIQEFKRPSITTAQRLDRSAKLALPLRDCYRRLSRMDQNDADAVLCSYSRRSKAVDRSAVKTFGLRSEPRLLSGPLALTDHRIQFDWNSLRPATTVNRMTRNTQRPDRVRMRYLFPTGTLALTVCLLSGCQSMSLTKHLPEMRLPEFDLSRRIPWKAQPHDPQGVPQRVVAIWTNAVLHSTGQRPMRGFGGRVFFYSNKSDKPIKVQGQLVVYAFVEKPGQQRNSIPDRKFVFRAEELQKYYSEAELGHSYSVWLPWDEVGGEQLSVKLIARFEPASGGIIVSPASPQMLPGRMDDRGAPAAAQESASLEEHAGHTSQHAASGSSVQRASYQEHLQGDPAAALERMAAASTAAASSSSGMKTETITLPSAFAQRYAGGFEDVSLHATAAEAAAEQTPAAGRGATAGQATATPRQESPPQPERQPARFAPTSRRALGKPISEPGDDRAPWQPYRARTRLRPE